ncbi:MAG: polysaccharide biosynthesis C-terminal domain-containing protein, partial [Candidatus Cloacimonetes bacterium]|nr:polysaccharide biosynthesis C-terminal domain-containing protein [Candidatus Cloacimonadota bacterium]
MQFMQHAGLALATSISAMIQFIILLHLMRKKIQKVHFPKVWGTIIKITFLSILIFIGLTFLNRFYDDVTFWETVLKTILLSLVSILFFIFGAQALRIEYSLEIRRKICRKFLKK